MSAAVAPLFLAACLAAAQKVEIRNDAQRYDVRGAPMDVHDGNIVQWTPGGLYYWYGMGYQNCSLEKGLLPPRDCPGISRGFGHCGFRDDHAVTIYSSPDLVSWSFEGDAFPPSSRPYGIYFRPKVLFNEQTGKYVLWVNHLPKAMNPLIAYPHAAYVVATSTSPTGPFELVTEKANLAVPGAGDAALFVDDDGSAYIAYDAWGNKHQVVVERLSDDYCDSLGAAASSGPVSPKGNEAPALFKRKGWYYLLYGNTCCFCATGSNAQVMTATSPLGPWTDAGYDIDGSPRKTLRPYNSTVRAQENGVFQATLASGETAFVWTGDQWTSAPDGLKSHDRQYWEPLSFDDSQDPPVIHPLHNVASFELELPERVLSI
jgi:hypothetical protein